MKATTKGSAWKPTLSTNRALLIFIICFCLYFLWYDTKYINVFLSGRTSSEFEEYYEEQITRDCPRSDDACSSCSGFQFASSAIKTKDRSCDPGGFVEYNSERNTFSINLGSAGEVDCPREVGAVEFPLPRTALVSFPGSGNTWTRHLIQQLTGFETGAVYNDQVLKQSGFPGEGKIDGVVVVKTHSLVEFSNYNFTKQIFILRNPYDALVAEYKRGYMRATHSGKVDITRDKKWLKFVKVNAIRWSSFFNETLLTPNPQLIVVYEDMKDCLLRELLRMSAFLSTPSLTRFSICCTLGNSVGRYYRNQGRAPLYELYNETIRGIINDKLSAAAAGWSQSFPGLARRLLEYRL